MEMKENRVSLSIIPRDVSEEVKKLIESYTHSILYGIGIGGPKIQSFLQNEVGIHTITTNTLADNQTHRMIVVPSKMQELI